VYAAYINGGESGWKEPRTQLKQDGDAGPDVDFSDPCVRMADMTGDGLADIVRIRSGRVEYWPALGHGRFGAAVVMRDSPRLDVLDNPEQLLLADVDGDGCADLVHVSGSGVTVFVNQFGNGWSEPIHDTLIPPPIPGTVQVADLMGTGSAGLVWNTPRNGRTAYVYYDFTPGTRPHLLATVKNGAGLLSEIHYRSAVQDARRDRDAGRAWQTFLPFPVTVVAATRERDVTTGQHAESRYDYHDGHFDPRSRQFQGFGRVEKREIGDASRSDSLTQFFFRMAQDRLPGNGPEHSALNRMLYRTELYGLDGSADQARPYHVEESEHGLTVLDELPDGRQRVWVTVTSTRQRKSVRMTSEWRSEPSRTTRRAT